MVETILGIVQTVCTVATIGLTLFTTVSRPLHKFSEQLAKSNLEQARTNATLNNVNTHLTELIAENKSEHGTFREMLTDHEKRIYKMED